MLVRRPPARIARAAIVAVATLVTSLAAGAVPAAAAEIRTGWYVDREGEGEGTTLSAARCGPSRNGREIVCNRRKAVRVVSGFGGPTPTEDLQCRAEENATSPVFSGTDFAGPTARITRRRTFKSTVRSVRRFTHENYDDTGNPDGTSWTTEEIVVGRIDGRFRGRTVSGTHEYSREVKLVSGSPREGMIPALGMCTTGVVAYSATRRR